MPIGGPSYAFEAAQAGDRRVQRRCRDRPPHRAELRLPIRLYDMDRHYQRGKGQVDRFCRRPQRVIPLSDRSKAVLEVMARGQRRFVPDSLLEGGGFEPSVPRQESRRFERASVPSRGGRCRRGGYGPGGDRRPDRAVEIADRRWCASEPPLESRIKPSRRVGPSRGTDGSNPSPSSGESGTAPVSRPLRSQADTLSAGTLRAGIRLNSRLGPRAPC